MNGTNRSYVSLAAFSGIHYPGRGLSKNARGDRNASRKSKIVI